MLWDVFPSRFRSPISSLDRPLSSSVDAARKIPGCGAGCGERRERAREGGSLSLARSIDRSMLTLPTANPICSSSVAAVLFPLFSRAKILKACKACCPLTFLDLSSFCLPCWISLLLPGHGFSPFSPLFFSCSYLFIHFLNHYLLIYSPLLAVVSRRRGRVTTRMRVIGWLILGWR